ncbi:MAG: sulfurtransferase [Gammaproteobacteria bacterium]|nr:sulfurtransferase [Gammaproteobacteria bacterium]
MPSLGPLIDIPNLIGLLSTPGLRLLDVRRGERYACGHLPDATHFSVYGINIFDTDPACMASFVKMWAGQIGMAGISRDDTLVVYGDRTDEAAARAFWFMEYLGHPRVAVLDGGFLAWSAAGHAIERVAEPPKAVAYRYELDESRVATWREVKAAIGAAETHILDTRSEQEWLGNDRRGTSRGGAVPGALHQEWKHNLAVDGRLRPVDELRALYAERGLRPENEVIAYCNTGYRSAHAYLALRVLGYPRVRNYVGSWQEWAERGECPIVRPASGATLAPLA